MKLAVQDNRKGDASENPVLSLLRIVGLKMILNERILRAHEHDHEHIPYPESRLEVSGVRTRDL